jgi:Ca2+-binding RTX toxin-like protein
MLLVMAMTGALIVTGGVAFAATFITCDRATDRDPDPGQCQGTNREDLIDGTQETDVIRALASDDFVVGFAGNDEIYGDEGNDIVGGYEGNDTIYGGPDGDGSAIDTSFFVANLEGHEDSDTVYGEGGNDWIDAAAFDTLGSVDSSFGGSGNDRIYAADGNEDIINCGTGTRDRAFIDSEDTRIRGCERITPVVE